jgi:hypothetical protein
MNNNRILIEEQINMKQQSKPFFATSKNITKIITEYDTFPFLRFYKCIPKYDLPIIDEREAGFNPRIYDYNNSNSCNSDYINNCFIAYR